MATRTTDVRGRLLDASLKLMLQRGYGATSVDDVCRAAKVTKGAFFHYFESKEAMARATAELFAQSQCDAFASAPFREAEDPLERVHGRIDFLARMARDPDAPKCCLIGTLAQEISASHPELRRLCDDVFARAAQDFERDLAEAKARHAPRASFEPKSVARMWLALVQGSLLLVKASQKADVLAENAEHFRRYVDALFARPRPRVKAR